MMCGDEFRRWSKCLSAITRHEVTRGHAVAFDDVIARARSSRRFGSLTIVKLEHVLAEDARHRPRFQRCEVALSNGQVIQAVRSIR